MSDQWKPIATAPTDRLIDIWIPHGNNGSGARWVNCHQDPVTKHWRTIDLSGRVAWVSDRAVTHWMPLPKPPR